MQMIHLLWLATHVLAQSALASPPTQVVLSTDVLPVFPDPSHLIFASFVGLLKQWPNTYFPNGHSVVLGTIPPSTLLYHARKDLNLPPKTEWLAFDAEMSYGIMSGRGGETQLLTYVASRPLRVLYVDGQSAALGESGWLDSQALLIYGNVTEENRGWSFSEYERARALCELGDDWGFDGVVRMNAGFELLHCNFNKGLELVSRLNVTDPYSEEGLGFPAPPDSPDHIFALLKSRSSLNDAPPTPPGFPRRPGGPRYPGRYPYGPGRRSQTSPFAASSNWEWQRSATWHYSSPERRVVLDLSTFVSLYDPVVKSLAQTRARDGIENSREKQRLLGINSTEAAAVKSKIRIAVKEKNRRGWTTSRTGESGVDWMDAAESVVDRFGGRIEEIRWTLGQNATNSTAGPHTNSTTKALAARRVAYALVFPYLDMSNYANSTRDPKAWIESSQRRCRVAFTHSPTASAARLAPAEHLIRASIEGVVGRICSTVLNIFGESLLLGLTVRLDEIPEHPAALEARAESAVAQWREELEGLSDWLGWSSALQCDRKCAPNEICQLPVWPLVSMGRRRGPWDGGAEEAAAAPVCVSWQP